jgi:hypothetical protein
MAPRLSRRQVLGLGLGALSAARLRRAAANNEGGKLHGLSAFGELKYPAAFHHFDYVNVDAPKGGTFSQLVGSGGPSQKSPFHCCQPIFLSRLGRMNKTQLTGSTYDPCLISMLT